MTADLLQHLTIPGHLSLSAGHGGLTVAKVTTEWSTAEIYLNGAHVTSFQKNGESPLLFLSKESLFTPGKAIRGGVPIIFPWFGGREGHQAHGFARTTEWSLEETSKQADGTVTLRFLLPENLFSCRVEYHVTVGAELTLALTVTNPTEETVSYEGCLHTYFTVGSIDQVSVSGLNGGRYIDQLDGNVVKTESQEAVTFDAELDRIYLDTPAMLEILDGSLKRKIILETTGCHSAVVWNPWIDKSQRMADFGNEEYRKMVCVESGNVSRNKINLAAQGIAHMELTLKSLAF